MEEKDVLEKAYKLAFDYEAKYGGCGQMTLAAILDALDIDADDGLYKSSTGLAAGIGLAAEGTCGAVLGGVLAIGMLFGRGKGEFVEVEKKRRVYRLVREFCDEFKKIFGSQICGDIQYKLFGKKFDLLDTKALQEFLEKGAHKDKCTNVCGTAAKLATSIILREIKYEK